MAKSKKFDTDTKNKFALAVRTNRAALKWTQEKLAEASDVNITTIAFIEAGKTIPRLTTARKLALAFKKSLSEFLENGGL